MKQFLTYEADQHHLKLISTGEWMLGTVLQIEKELLKIPYDKKIVWDVSGISDFDSAGVLLFIEYYERFQKETDVEIVGYTENQKDMYTLLHRNIPPNELSRKKGMLENLGKRTYEILDEIKSLITFLGHRFYAMFKNFVKYKKKRFKEII